MKSKSIILAAVFAAAGLLAAHATSQDYLRFGAEHIVGFYFHILTQVVDGTAPYPYQARLLCPFTVTFLVKHLPLTTCHTLLFSRWFLDFALLIMLAIMLRGYAIGPRDVFISMAMCGWALSYCDHGATLAHDNRVDVIAYITAVVLLRRDKPLWIIPLTAVAATNRATSGLIPMLALVYGHRKTALAGWITWAVVYGSIFWHYWPHPFVVQIEDKVTWGPFRFPDEPSDFMVMFAVLSLIPFIALARWRHWPRQLRLTFWCFLLPWLTIHSLIIAWGEPRLCMVPLAILFLPGVFAEEIRNDEHL